MTLFAATLSTALVLVAAGLVLLWNGPALERGLKAFPRSPVATFVLFGGGAAWFLWHIANLGPADFGEFRQYFFAFFAVCGVAAFFVARDFLAVRGLAILLLLCARPLLDASLVYYPPPGTRVALNAFVYLVIVLALYFGTLPYQLRDFFLWFFQKPARPRVLGAALGAYGLLLTAIATTYYNTY